VTQRFNNYSSTKSTSAWYYSIPKYFILHGQKLGISALRDQLSPDGRPFPQRPQSTKYKACSCSATKQIRLQREPTHLVIKITRACRELMIFYFFLHLFDRKFVSFYTGSHWLLDGYLMLFSWFKFLASFYLLVWNLFLFCTRLNFLFLVW